MFNKLPLFASNIYTTHIDPSSYDKKGIIDTVVKNYELSPSRNSWDVVSKLHHYYQDWDNPKFKRIDLSSLIGVYDNIFKTFVSQNFKNKKNIKYAFKIVNVTVYKDENNSMDVHSHVEDVDDGECLFSAVHYLKADKESQPLILDSPLIFGAYLNSFYKSFFRDSCNNKEDTHSAFFRFWKYQPVEDEIIIFPAFLKHHVDALKTKNNNYRIAVVINFYMYGDRNSQ